MTAPSQNESRAARGALLIGLARRAIQRHLGITVAPRDDPGRQLEELPWLQEPAATFVTLEIEGRLRGCVGSLEAERELRDDVEANARAAAFRDSRFSPLAVDELDDLSVEVSVLSALEPIECRDEAELVDTLRPGVDGVVLECGSNRATFLPQVWEHLREPSDFLGALRTKAGLERQFWSQEMRFWRYTVEKYQE